MSLRCLLAGYGEIGKAVKQVYGGVHHIEVLDPQQGLMGANGPYDLLLVAIPYSDAFVTIVREYQSIFQVAATIVFSTVAIGTCSQLPNTVHCPIEGRHPDLAESIGASSRWIGGVSRMAERFFTEARVPFRVLAKPEWTEWLKLRSTTTFGVFIEWARYSARVSESIEMPYCLCNEWDDWYNHLYADHFEQTQYLRPRLYAPEGKVGGHCVTPNARILTEQYPDPLVDIVAGGGE